MLPFIIVIICLRCI